LKEHFPFYLNLNRLMFLRILAWLCPSPLSCQVCN
jgi:hypothetical protein